MPIRPSVIALVVALANVAPMLRGEERPNVANVDFERHVSVLFRRLGCNAGACHGSFEGQGGFRLSLFGQSPANDFTAITGDIKTRRVVVDAPDESLILAKPSQRVDHEGGLRLPKDSWEYAIIRRWIADGARYTANRGHVHRLVVEPASVRLAPGDSLPLSVVAQFADGTSETTTAFSEFRPTDETVVTVDADGRVAAVGPGYTSIIASYRGMFVHASIVVPFPPADGPSPHLSPANLIDEEIDGRLDLLSLASSPSSSDAEFLRRATLDVLGTLPNVGDVRDFLADDDLDKRARATDRLLAHPRRATVWAAKMCDVTACNVDTMESPAALRPKRAKMWHDWFRHRFAENVRYDEIARAVLCATSRGGETIERWVEDEIRRENGALVSFESDYCQRRELDLYWRRIGADGPTPIEDFAELTASAFLGLRLHCARCHHHPYDRWSQRDFAGFAQILSRVRFDSSTELRSEINRQLEIRRQNRGSGVTYPPLPRLQEVYLSASRRPLVDAAAEASALPTAPGGPVLDDSSDARNSFTDWLVQPNNPYFAKSFVNRIWAKYFGAGLVEPVDDMSASNPSRHPSLLDRLAAEFVRCGYDIAHIERLILNSNAYQRSTRSVANNGADSRAFSHASVRPLPAETLIDALNTALETMDDFGPDVPGGSTAYDVAPNRLNGTDLDTVFRFLGRPDRRSLCDCDRALGPSIRQPIYLMSDPRVIAKISQGRLARLLAEGSDNRTILTELYLATLSRFPDEDELAYLDSQVSAASDRSAGFTDVLWGIINTREFSTNH
ncbi:MAG TPA: DUF1549 domain-containing protein [Pirellulales bacterium]|nr:DUF1549 domain-containing protein [Pirellulales bacterium]